MGIQVGFFSWQQDNAQFHVFSPFFKMHPIQEIMVLYPSYPDTLHSYSIVVLGFEFKLQSPLSVCLLGLPLSWKIILHNMAQWSNVL